MIWFANTCKLGHGNKCKCYKQIFNKNKNNLTLKNISPAMKCPLP